MLHASTFSKLATRATAFCESNRKHLPMAGNRCSFCGRGLDHVGKLFQGNGPQVFICDECVVTCHEILAGAGALPPKRPHVDEQKGAALRKLLKERLRQFLDLDQPDEPEDDAPRP
jgi:hypothetical protein